MSDERNSEQQAGGLTDLQSVGAHNLATEELLLDNPEQASSSEVTTLKDSSEEVTTPELSTGEVTIPEIPSSVEVVSEVPAHLEVIPSLEVEPEVPSSAGVEPEVPSNEAVESEVPSNEAVESEVPSNEAVESEVPSSEAVEPEVPSNEAVETEVPSNTGVEPEVPSDGVASGEVPLVSTVNQSEPTDKTLPVEVPCDPCDPADPYGLKSDPGCELPLCKPPPEEPQEDREPFTEESPLSAGEQLARPLPEDEGDTPGEPSEVQEQEGDVSEETKDLADPCEDPEEPACDFPKPAAEKSVGGLRNEELEGQDIGDDMKDGSLPEDSPADSRETPVPDSVGGEPLEQELVVEMDPCGPRDPCGFQVDVACLGPEDASVQSSASPGELQSADTDGAANPQTDRQQEL